MSRPSRPRYRYHPQVLAALEPHGLRPRPTDDPRAVYELLKSIYTFEIKGLRADFREKERVLGPQPRQDLRRELQRLKDRYPILRVPSHRWAQREAQENSVPAVPGGTG